MSCQRCHSKLLQWPAAGGLVITCLLLAGCGNEFDTVDVRGIVTLDGAPLSQGEVVFMPEQGPPAKAAIQSDGSFVLGTYNVNDGAVAGQHQVAVIARRGTPPTEGDDAGWEWIVPARYGSPATSELAFEVQPHGDNHARLDLRSE